MTRRAALPALSLAAALWAASGAGALADDLWDKLAADPALLGQELRAMLLEEPEIIADTRAEARERMAADAASALADEIAGDHATIAALSGPLFATTARGFGAAQGPARLTVFTAAPCGACDAALADLHQLAAEVPDLRIEIRSAADTAAERLARALEMTQGAETARAFRRAMAATPEAEPAEVLRAQGVDPGALPVTDRLAESIQADAALFAELGLDTVPSYVMTDRLIRGAMPGIVLRRYLSE